MERVSKSKAKHMFVSGQSVYMLPNNVALNNMWISPVKMEADIKSIESFEKCCNNFSYYNCSTELGKNIHFYVQGD